MTKSSRSISNSAASFDGHVNGRKTKRKQSRTATDANAVTKPTQAFTPRQLTDVLNTYPNLLNTYPMIWEMSQVVASKVQKIECIQVGNKAVHQLTTKLGSEISVRRRRYRSEKLRELERDVWWK